jgi:hypothetical protein
MSKRGITPIAFEIEGISQSPRIELAIQRNGRRKWAIRKHGYTFTKSGQWEYEPLPSSRTTSFLRRARFNSETEALQALYKIRTKGQARRVLARLLTRLEVEPTFHNHWKALNRKQRAKNTEKFVKYLMTQEYPIYDILETCPSDTMSTAEASKLTELSLLLSSYTLDSNLAI